MITHGSTFSGIGAPEIAAEMLGWKNVFHCEINPFGRKILDYYFPKAKSYEDITKTDFSEWKGKVTVLTGGFPCQPFSYAGKRRGSEDDRYLWPFMLRCIQQVRPTWFVGENVAGISTMVFPGETTTVGSEATIFGQTDHIRRDERYVIEEICQQLEAAGYSVQPILIPACAVGAPHRRDRIFFIAHITADSPCSGYGSREPGKDGGTKSEIRVQERNEIQQSYEPTNVRSEMQTDNARNSYCCNDGEKQEIFGRENSESCGICGIGSRRAAADTTCEDIQGGYMQRESCCKEQGKPCGKNVKNDITDTTCSGGGAQSQSGRAESDRSDRFSQQSERREPSKWNNGLSSFQWNNAYADCSLLQRRNGGSSQKSRSVKRIKPSYRYLLPENRWRAFPSVSPVYRGNDGLPFSMDDLTIPFGKWKTESIKAYGNAIVVQVMYDIFRYIDQIENESK